MDENLQYQSVLVTGATGFVGRAVVRELLARGLRPVCLVRSPRKLRAQHADVASDRITAVAGGLSDRRALATAAACQAVIHLVGIIIARRLRGQTFHRVHVTGTRNVLEAASRAGVRRFVHMSALGTRPDAVSTYHRTKWEAEERVRSSGLEWTVFRPSLIHGPEGEFMRLMKAFICGLVPPVVPYFGTGQGTLQPVSVKDVAYCFVESLFRPEAVGKVYPLGGPTVYTWLQLYDTCRRLMPGAKRWKPYASLAPGLAKVVAAAQSPAMALAELVVPSLGMFRFDGGQVQMSQEMATCDATIAEQVFGIKMRGFEEELSSYAGQIE